MSRNDTYPQHVVTAVIVAHDGAPWLPDVVDALLGQTRPVQRVVAVDTGSRDRSGGLLAAKLGQGVVFGMDRATGYGTAVARALQHKAANVAVPGGAAPGRPDSADRVEWIWLLHDDCEPAADALEQLLRGAAETANAAVLGPKVMDWSDRDVILEAGLTIDTVGRRISGIEPREVDQGQHDGDRDTLAVGSAGMLIRRDVWEQVRGFDTSMGLYREDIDFCWRVHAAGYRVRVITDAVVFHMQAMTRRRRAVSVGRRAQLLDRRNALLTLAGNLPFGPMLRSLAGNVGVSILRALFFLVAKRVTAALDETAAVVSVLGHPLRLWRARRLRARGRAAAYGRLRADLPPGRSLRRIAEFAAAMSSSAQQDTTGSHHATDDPEADDFLLTDTGLVQRILTSPSVLLLLALLIVTGIAERSLLTAGTLGGGALLPATSGATGLWHEYLQGFHPTGIGSPSIGPPYLAFLAVVATILLGKAWLAVDVVLLGSVPIAGMTAFLAVRKVTASVPVRVWAAATYALIPVATGAIAAGRIGTAVVFALVPVVGLQVGQMFSQPPKIARRAAWGTGLAIAVGTAFVPLLWIIALVAAGIAALTLRSARPGILRNIGIAVLVPLVLLIPWTFQLLMQPSALLLEAGAQQAGLATPDLAARSLMLLSPGGPGLPPMWVTGGLIIAALAALLATRRRILVLSGWAVAVLGLLVAVLTSRMSVEPAAGGPAVTVWSGAALAVTAAGLLLAAASCGDSLGTLLAAGRTGLRKIASLRGALIAVLVIVACTAPVAAAGFWLLNGVSGPIGPIGPNGAQVVPPLVAVSAGRGSQVRTLVLRGSGSRVSFLLLRATGPTLGDADLVPVPSAERALSSAVSALTAPSGGQAVNQAQALAGLDIGFVLMRAPINLGLARTLDGVEGLRPVSMTAGFDLWRLSSLPSRVSVLESSGAVLPVPSGQVGVSGATAPAAGGTLLLAEPAGGWSASLNGHSLTSVPSPAGNWAQAFRLPSGGGTLDVSHGDLGHDIAIVLEMLLVLVVAALALPGVRAAAEVVAAEAAVGGDPRASEAVIPEPADPALARERRSARGRSAPGRSAPGRPAPAAGVAPADPVLANPVLANPALANPAGGGPPLAGAARSDPALSDPALASPARAGSALAGSAALADLGAGSPRDRIGAGLPGRDRPADGLPARGSELVPDRAAVLSGSGGGGHGGKGRSRGKLGRRGRRGEPDEPGTERMSPAAALGRGRGRGRQQADDAAPGIADASDATAAWPVGQPGGAQPGGAQPGRGPDADGRDWAGVSSPAPAGTRPSGRDLGARSPTGAWPYPDDASVDSAEPPSMPRPYAPEPGRRPAAQPTGQYPVPSRPGQDRPGQDRPGQDRPGQDRSGQDQPEPRYRDPQYPVEPRYQEPQYPDPQYRDPRYQEAPYAEPQYRDPRYQESRYQDAQYQDAQYQDSQYRDSQYRDSRHHDEPYRDDRYREPQFREPQFREPQPREPQPREPQPREPQYRDPRYGDPKNREPQPGEPQYRDHQYGGPQYQDPSGRPPRRTAEPPASPWTPVQPPAQQPDPWSARQQSAASSWPDHQQPASWSSDDQTSWGGDGRGGASGWHGNGQPPADPAYYGQGQQEWQGQGQQPGWPSPGESLEPLPSAEVHHGAPGQSDDRARRRWPAPDDDDADVRDDW